MMGHRLRRRISSILLNATVVSSICFGLLPFYYSKQQQRFVTSKLLNIYNVCINVLFVVIMACLLSIFSNFNDAFQSGDPLAELLNRITVYISFCGILTTWWINWNGRQRLQQLFNEFVNIEIIYFSRYKHFTVECATFDYYVMWKVFATFLQNVSFFYSTTIAGDSGSLFIAFMCLTALLTNVMLLVSTHFFLAVLFTYRFIWALNRRLECMTSSVLTPRQQHTLSTEIDSIAYIYIRLIGLCERYTRIHQYQLLLVISAMTICNIEVLFYVRLLWSGKVNEPTALNVLAILQIFVVNVLDFWLTITICELALVTSRRTLAILRSFSAKPRLSTHLERSLECFAIVCSCKKLRFHLCGLFDINHSSGLKVLLTMILYLIYLVQYYHKNL